MTRFVIPRVVFVNLEFNCCNYPPSPSVNEKLICMELGEVMRRHASKCKQWFKDYGHGRMLRLNLSAHNLITNQSQPEVVYLINFHLMNFKPF